MAIDHEDVAIRADIWEKANEMVGPLVEEHGLEEVTFGGGMFVTSDVITPIDQHISAIMRVANWLLDKED